MRDSRALACWTCPVNPRHVARAAANVLNLTTPAAVVGTLLLGGRLRTGRDGLLVASGGLLTRLPPPAMTIGGVVLLRDPGVLQGRPQMWVHEARHATQYAWCLGLPFLPLYAVASAWSYLRCGDASSANVFERLAGHRDGGYAVRPPRPLIRRSSDRG